MSSWLLAVLLQCYICRLRSIWARFLAIITLMTIQRRWKVLSVQSCIALKTNLSNSDACAIKKKGFRLNNLISLSKPVSVDNRIIPLCQFVQDKDPGTADLQKFSFFCR